MKPLSLPWAGLCVPQSDQPNKETEIKVSLRSIDGFDTSAISSVFGGGGHAAASSCIIKREELKSWQDMAI
jgi:nanoRNase/pAp phosphatase (c-di-AMP/oligoRNAs hydrolase)